MLQGSGLRQNICGNISRYFLVPRASAQSHAASTLEATRQLDIIGSIDRYHLVY